MSARRNREWVVLDHGRVIGCTDLPMTYSDGDVSDLLDRAAALGFDLGPGSLLEQVTVAELAMLVDDLTTC